jgi:hypothetical protein
LVLVELAQLVAAPCPPRASILSFQLLHQQAAVEAAATSAIPQPTVEMVVLAAAAATMTTLAVRAQQIKAGRAVQVSWLWANVQRVVAAVARLLLVQTQQQALLATVATESLHLSQVHLLRMRVAVVVVVTAVGLLQELVEQAAVVRAA